MTRPLTTALAGYLVPWLAGSLVIAAGLAAGCGGTGLGADTRADITAVVRWRLQHGGFLAVEYFAEQEP